MPSNNFILGKYDRQAYTTKDVSRSATRWEGDVAPYSAMLTTFYTNAHIFSKHTERDETQAVGKLYKGTVDDE